MIDVEKLIDRLRFNEADPNRVLAETAKKLEDLTKRFNSLENLVHIYHQNQQRRNAEAGVK